MIHFTVAFGIFILLLCMVFAFALIGVNKSWLVRKQRDCSTTQDSEMPESRIEP